MGQIFSSKVDKNEAVENTSLSSNAQGQNYCTSIGPNHLTEMQQRVYRPLLSWRIESHGSESSVVNNSSTLCSDPQTEDADYEEETKYFISSKHEPIGSSKRVFKNGTDVERRTGENMLDERNTRPYTSSIPGGRSWVVNGTPLLLGSQEAFSSAANTATTSLRHSSLHNPTKQEDTKDKKMNKHEPREPTKHLLASEAESITKVDLVRSNIVGAISSIKENKRTTKPHSTSSAPGRCWAAKGISPHLPVSHKASSSAETMVNTSCNQRNKNKKTGIIGPYNSTQRILLLGEGDFSFSARLSMAFGSASNIVATSLNSREFLIKNYGNFPTNLSELETRGSVVLHGVDATQMAKHPDLFMMKFDRIIFNFPHAGFKHDSPKSEIRRHQKLVRGFLRNAKIMIEVGGQIHVTHKSNAAFLKWGIPKLGIDQGLNLIQEANFNRKKYPGYHTKFGFGGDTDFNCYPSKTYMFGLSS